MVTLTTAFDVSVDEPEKRFLVMAGFVSDAHGWKEGSAREFVNPLD
jgi:hypothetical protein